MCKEEQLVVGCTVSGITRYGSIIIYNCATKQEGHVVVAVGVVVVVVLVAAPTSQ